MRLCRSSNLTLSPGLLPGQLSLHMQGFDFRFIEGLRDETSRQLKIQLLCWNNYFPLLTFQSSENDDQTVFSCLGRQMFEAPCFAFLETAMAFFLSLSTCVSCKVKDLQQYFRFYLQEQNLDCSVLSFHTTGYTQLPFQVAHFQSIQKS